MYETKSIVSVKNILMSGDTDGFIHFVSTQTTKQWPLQCRLSVYMYARGLTLKLTNSPPCACRGSSGHKPQYDLMTFVYQHFTAVLLIYGSLFLSGVYYCLSVFWCAIARMSEIEWRCVSLALD
jgi:hypothetical protein